MNEQETLAKLVVEYGHDDVIKAIKDSVYRKKTSIGYVSGILENRELWDGFE